MSGAISESSMTYMKQKQKQSEASGARPTNGGVERTFFEQAIDLQVELRKAMGLPWNHLPTADTNEMPKWCSKIAERFRKTTLKPILKLRPNGTVNWRHYGRMMGIIERWKTFITHDLERNWIEEGFDKITDEQWEKIRLLLGEDKFRAHLEASLGRPVANDESLEKLVEEALERRLEFLEKLKRDACWHIAQQSAKITALFFKGMSEGYTCFLDEQGRFVGDRGRTHLYYDFLAYRLEIEQFRRTMPVKTRRDLQRWIIEKTKIPITDDNEWFDHFCDEISLSTKGAGRPAKGPVL
jgi:hypothetical protein